MSDDKEIAEQDTRPAQAGETGTTRFGQNEGLGEEAPGGLGASGGSGNPSSSGLQPGGIMPGGGPAAMAGSIGTGGGSNADRATGDADENNIDEDVK